MPSSYNPPGGGGGGGSPTGAAGGGLSGTYPNPSVNPQIPAWEYTGGTMGAGQFSSDNLDISLTTFLIFSPTVAGGLTTGEFSSLSPNTVFVLTDEAGQEKQADIAIAATGATESSDPIRLANHLRTVRR